MSHDTHDIRVIQTAGFKPGENPEGALFILFATRFNEPDAKYVTHSECCWGEGVISFALADKPKEVEFEAFVCGDQVVVHVKYSPIIWAWLHRAQISSKYKELIPFQSRESFRRWLEHQREKVAVAQDRKQMERVVERQIRAAAAHFANPGGQPVQTTIDPLHPEPEDQTKVMVATSPQVHPAEKDQTEGSDKHDLGADAPHPDLTTEVIQTKDWGIHPDERLVKGRQRKRGSRRRIDPPPPPPRRNRIDPPSPGF